MIQRCSQAVATAINWVGFWGQATSDGTPGRSSRNDRNVWGEDGDYMYIYIYNITVYSYIIIIRVDYRWENTEFTGLM